MLMKELDRIIHQPVRTRIMAHLINVEECDYTSLKNTLKLSDGHMSTHMKELLACNYIEMKKEFIDNKPKTTYKITKTGKKQFSEYVNTLKSLIAMK